MRLPAQIKWPNDVLLNQRKAAGVLVEARWDGEELNAAVIGIGINIAPESVNPLNLPPAGLNFPATCVEDELGHPVDRLELLHAILEAVLLLASSPCFSQTLSTQWEDSLAYKDQWVELQPGISRPILPSGSCFTSHLQLGKVIGLTMDGSLKLLTRSGELVTAQVGEIHLRPSPLTALPMI